MNNKVLRFLFFFLAFLLIFQLFGRSKNGEGNKDDVALILKSKWPLGKEVQVQIKNNLDAPISIPSRCPENPLKVERYVNGEWLPLTAKTDPLKCAEQKEWGIEPHKTALIAYGLWNAELFKEKSRYRISLTTTIQEKEKTFSKEFEITAPGVLRTAWNTALYRPIYNGLIYLSSHMPGKDLGLAIILLTLGIKLILLGPNQKALKAQKLMQKIQPELEALKLKYKDDSKHLAQETMAVWKKYKVSPLSSCLPLFIQLPILIALFYAVKGGLNVVDPAILYPSLKTADLSAVNTHFLGLLELTKKNLIALPLMVGVLQFLQMRMTFSKTKEMTLGGSNPLPSMNKMMQYMMPVMIAFFTATLPAAVGFYWGVSTVFGIGQQWIVNRKKD